MLRIVLICLFIASFKNSCADNSFTAKQGYYNKHIKNKTLQIKGGLMNDVDLSKPSGMSKASLILGICSIIPMGGYAIGLAAIIIGIIDLVKIKDKKAGAPGKKLDITGIILGIILPWVFVIIMVAIFGAAYFTTIGASYLMQ